MCAWERKSHEERSNRGLGAETIGNIPGAD